MSVTTQGIDVVWAAFFGLSPVEFMRPGIQIVAHHRLADFHGVWLFRHHASPCLSVPPDLVKTLRTMARAYTVESLFSEPGVRALLGSRIERVIGPHIKATLRGLNFGLRLMPESVPWRERMRRRCGGSPTPAKPTSGSKPGSPGMNLTSSAAS